MYSRNEGWNRRGRWGVSTAELRDEREEEEGERVQQETGDIEKRELSRGEKWKSEERGEGSTVGTRMEHRRQM
jgi:hypothetical protein